jgi:hypothetical protein
MVYDTVRNVNPTAALVDLGTTLVMSAPPDMCNCGSPLQDHVGGSCPGAQDDPVVADRRLLACLRGQVHLTLLEKMGKIPFL